MVVRRVDWAGVPVCESGCESGHAFHLKDSSLEGIVPLSLLKQMRLRVALSPHLADKVLLFCLCHVTCKPSLYRFELNRGVQSFPLCLLNGRCLLRCCSNVYSCSAVV